MCSKMFASWSQRNPESTWFVKQDKEFCTQSCVHLNFGYSNLTYLFSHFFKMLNSSTGWLSINKKNWWSDFLSSFTWLANLELCLTITFCAMVLSWIATETALSAQSGMWYFEILCLRRNMSKHISSQKKSFPPVLRFCNVGAKWILLWPCKGAQGELLCFR